MKLQHEYSRAVSSLNFDAGQVSIVVEVPESPFRMREQRSSYFVLSRDQGRELAAALIAWLEETAASP